MVTTSDINPLTDVMTSLKNESCVVETCEFGIHVSQLGPKGLSDMYYCLYDTATPAEFGYGTIRVFQNTATAETYCLGLQAYTTKFVLKPVRRVDKKVCGKKDIVRFLVYPKVFTKFREWISNYPNQCQQCADDNFYQVFRKFGELLVYCYENDCLAISLGDDIIITDDNDVFLLNPVSRDTKEEPPRVDADVFCSSITQLYALLALVKPKLNSSDRINQYMKFLASHIKTYQNNVANNAALPRELKQHGLNQVLEGRVLKYPVYWTTDEKLRLICTMYHLSHDVFHPLWKNSGFTKYAMRWDSWNQKIAQNMVLKEVYDHKPTFYGTSGSRLCFYAHNLMKHHREKTQAMNNSSIGVCAYVGPQGPVPEYSQYQVLDALLISHPCLVEEYYEAMFDAVQDNYTHHAISTESMFSETIGA